MFLEAYNKLPRGSMKGGGGANEQNIFLRNRVMFTCIDNLCYQKEKLFLNETSFHREN